MEINSVETSPFWEADSPSASQENTHLLWLITVQAGYLSSQMRDEQGE
jgi:hypothetical protein